MEEKFFLIQIKRTNGVYSKGVVVKDTQDEAEQSYYAYMAAYAFGHEAGTDYVQVAINDINGATVVGPKIWTPKTPAPEVTE